MPLVEQRLEPPLGLPVQAVPAHGTVVRGQRQDHQRGAGEHPSLLLVGGDGPQQTHHVGEHHPQAQLRAVVHLCDLPQLRGRRERQDKVQVQVQPRVDVLHELRHVHPRRHVERIEQQPAPTGAVLPVEGLEHLRAFWPQPAGRGDHRRPALQQRLHHLEPDGVLAAPDHQRHLPLESNSRRRNVVHAAQVPRRALLVVRPRPVSPRPPDRHVRICIDATPLPRGRDQRGRVPNRILPVQEGRLELVKMAPPQVNRRGRDGLLLLFHCRRLLAALRLRGAVRLSALSHRHGGGRGGQTRGRAGRLRGVFREHAPVAGEEVLQAASRGHLPARLRHAAPDVLDQGR
mmetsp:Transcript_33269/g.93284  ORF Transcript_33269/g.93284 Transcript_33269/m.93284 type:complete len:345 (+) Transcript_33269:3209-4243(+)